MQLLSSLLLLGGGPFLSTYGPQLMSACTAYVGEVVERGLLLMLPPVDLLLVAAPQQAAPLVLPFMQVGGWVGGWGRRERRRVSTLQLLNAWVLPKPASGW